MIRLHLAFLDIMTVSEYFRRIIKIFQHSLLTLVSHIKNINLIIKNTYIMFKENEYLSHIPTSTNSKLSESWTIFHHLIWKLPKSWCRNGMWSRQHYRFSTRLVGLPVGWCAVSWVCQTLIARKTWSSCVLLIRTACRRRKTTLIWWKNSFRFSDIKVMVGRWLCNFFPAHYLTDITLWIVIWFYDEYCLHLHLQGSYFWIETIVLFLLTKKKIKIGEYGMIII